MHPILFRFGDFRLSMYGLMIAVAFVVGFTYVARAAKKEGEDPEVYLDLCYYILIFAIIGSRIFYIVINWDYYWQEPLAVFKVWQGGLVFYGGLIGAILVCIYYVHKHKLNFWKMVDVLIPALPLGHVFGRIGCFFAGCCYGQHSPNLPWAITFSNPDSLAPKNIPLHPTQIYSSTSNLLLFLFLLIFMRYKKFNGQVFATYLIAYPIIRSFVELFRGDVARKFLPIPGAPQLISTAQFVSIIIFTSGVGIYIFLKRKNDAALL